MKKINKTICSVIFGAIFLAGGLLLANPVQAGELLEVTFENEPEPLFQKTNFLPGDEVSAWVKVENISGETQKIGVEIIDKLEPPCQEYCLSDKLNLVITEGENGTPLVDGSLTTFYESGETYLSDLEAGEKTVYYFYITFNPETNNNYQGSEAKFDIKIGAFGEESISGEIIPGGGSGGGGVFIAGLQIFSESASDITNNSATITWQTNYESTSRVIYSPDGFPHLLKVNDPPNYGYVFSTPENSNKVTFHSVTIDGLLPGTTYYFRCISHASPPTISREYSFTTLGVKEEKKKEGEKEEKAPPEEKKPPFEEIPTGEEGEEISSGEKVALAPEGEKKPTKSEELPERIEEKEREKREKEKETEGLKETGALKEQKKWLNKLLAGIGTVILNLKLLLAILFVILLGLIILGLFKKRKKRAEESSSNQ